jgi:RES domain-containing protein
MFVYRIAHPRYIRDLSGEGARIYGGRWNPKGIACLYTSDASSLALLEFAVHHTRDNFPEKLKIIEIWVDDKLEMETVDWHFDALTDLSAQYTKIIGQQWLQKTKTPILKVPSVLVPYAFNLLINPTLIKANEIKITQLSDLKSDRRLKE